MSRDRGSNETNTPVETGDYTGTGLGITKRMVQELEPKVQLYDENDDGLQLYCYTSCSASDSNLVKACRGVVFHGDTLVMRSFAYTPEFTNNDYDHISVELTGFELDQCRILDSHEATLARVCFFNGKWIICTHKRLNVFKSKWASTHSFGDILVEALKSEYELKENLKNRIDSSEVQGSILDKFLSTLNPDNKYMILIRNIEENRIVCNAPETPIIYHAGTYIGDDPLISFDDNIGLSKPREHRFQSIEAAQDYVKKEGFKHIQGVIIFKPDGSHFKIVNEQYKELFNVRGNEPSLRLRYLEVRKHKIYRDALYFLYPDRIKSFIKYENLLFKFAKDLYKKYIRRFIKEKYVNLPDEEFTVVLTCHKWQQKNPDKHFVTMSKVYNVINEQRPVTLNRMIRAYIVSKLNTNNGYNQSKPAPKSKPKPRVAKYTPKKKR